MANVFVDSSIVIVANDINLSIFKPHWFAKCGFFREEDLNGKILISPIAVQIPTDKFEIAIFPNRIQFTMVNIVSDSHSEMVRILGGIIRALPHTPYKGIGLNFDYLITPHDESSFESWNRNLFAPKFEKSIEFLSQINSRFGSYFSFDILGGRLKIDIKPTRGLNNISDICQSWNSGQEVMKINYNLHYEIDTNKDCVENILRIFDNWPNVLSLTEKINTLIFIK